MSKWPRKSKLFCKPFYLCIGSPLLVGIFLYVTRDTMYPSSRKLAYNAVLKLSHINNNPRSHTRVSLKAEIRLCPSPLYAAFLVVQQQRGNLAYQIIIAIHSISIQSHGLRWYFYYIRRILYTEVKPCSLFTNIPVPLISMHNRKVFFYPLQPQSPDR